MFLLACLLLLPSSVWSFLNSKSTKINFGIRYCPSVVSSRLFCTANEEDDPYGDLMDFNKPIEIEESAEMINVWSIDSSIDAGSLAKTRMTPKTAQQQWEHWDEFMEQEFGNMDAEITEDQKWMIDMRDMVEQKRGIYLLILLTFILNMIVSYEPPFIKKYLPIPYSFLGFAIWSKKSEKELQRELKKALEKKALNVPDSVAMIIRAVYLEKTHTIKKIKADQELSFIGFRKWVIEQKKKTKKDPLPLARIEVSKVRLPAFL